MAREHRVTKISGILKKMCAYSSFFQLPADLDGMKMLRFDPSIHGFLKLPAQQAFLLVRLWRCRLEFTMRFKWLNDEAGLAAPLI